MTLSLTVAHKADVAAGIVAFELRNPDGAALPAFAAGAHILVETPAGVARRYSLSNAPSERDRYVIAVKREPEGGGGSISMIDRLGVGDTVAVGAPENYFPLVAEARAHLLIAGGIGITPILSMARQLRAEGADFRIIYCARAPELAAFRDVLAEPGLAERTTLHFDNGDPTQGFYFPTALASPAAGTHLYCCGPRPLMHAVREAAGNWPAGTVHFEDFGTSAQPATGGEGAFDVRLARSGRVVTVPAGVSILHALRAAGVEVDSSCEAGTCSSCRVGLLDGIADHRDFVLDEDEYASAIMVCVSRALTKELTLDV